MAILVEDGILFRYFASPIRAIKQLVVPTKLKKNQVLQTEHDSMFAGHLGRSKTLLHIQSQIHWPVLVGYVNNHVISCHVCQKMAEKGSVRSTPV